MHGDLDVDAGVTVVGLPEDALAAIAAQLIVHTLDDACAMRLACKSFGSPVEHGCRLACARLLGCDPSAVEAASRNAHGEGMLRAAAFAVRSHDERCSIAPPTTLTPDRRTPSGVARTSGQLGIGSTSRFRRPSTRLAIVAVSTTHNTSRGNSRPSNTGPVTPGRTPTTGRRRADFAVGRWPVALVVAMASGSVYVCGTSIGAGVPADGPDHSTSLVDGAVTASSTMSSTSSAVFVTWRRHAGRAMACRYEVQQVAAGQMHTVLPPGWQRLCMGGTCGEFGDGQLADSLKPLRVMPEPAIHGCRWLHSPPSAARQPVASTDGAAQRQGSSA